MIVRRLRCVHFIMQLSLENFISSFWLFVLLFWFPVSCGAATAMPQERYITRIVVVVWWRWENGWHWNIFQFFNWLIDIWQGLLIFFFVFWLLLLLQAYVSFVLMVIFGLRFSADAPWKGDCSDIWSVYITKAPRWSWAMYDDLSQSIASTGPQQPCRVSTSNTNQMVEIESAVTTGTSHLKTLLPN